MAKIGTKPNGIHFLDVHVEVDGVMKRQRVSCDTRDRQDAETQRKQWIAGVHPKHPAMGGAVAPKGRVSRLIASSSPTVRATGWTMEKLWDRCLKDPKVWAGRKAQRTIQSNVKIMGRRFGQTLITDVTYKFLCDVVADMEREGYMPASIQRHMAMVSRSLTAATKYEDASGKPLLLIKPEMPHIIVKNEKDRVLEHDEEPLVWAAIDARELKEPGRQWGRFRMFIRVMLDTAFRKGEMYILGPHSVQYLRAGNQERMFLGLPRYGTKNGKPRLVPCTAAVEALVPTLNGQAVGGRWFPMESTCFLMWNAIRKDVKAMGGNIDDVTIHTFRHTCLTRLAKAGMELQRLSLWAGHSDVSITARRYSHLDASDLIGGVDLLGTLPTSKGKQDRDPELSVISNPSIAGGNRAELGTLTVQ